MTKDFFISLQKFSFYLHLHRLAVDKVTAGDDSVKDNSNL